MQPVLASSACRALLDRVLSARSIDEIALARQEVKAWRDTHPSDEGMSFALDRLARMQDAVEAIAAGHASA